MPRLFRITLFALAALCFAAGPAAGQDGGGSERTVKERHRDWLVVCQKDDGAPCRAVQNINAKDSEKRVMVVEAGRVDGRPVIGVTTPLGVALQAGIALKVDDGEQYNQPYTVCLRDGCRATFHPEDSLLTAMKKGLEMEVGFKNPGGKTMVVPVSLKGFTAAWNAL